MAAEEVTTFPRGRAIPGRDWTKGSIMRNLLALSWPMMVSNSLNMLGPTIDMIWVGRLGAAAIAAVGVAGMAVMMVDSMRMGIVMGARAMIARFVGSGDDAQANHVAQQGFAISAIFAVVMAIIGVFLAEPILRLLGVGDDVVALGAPYMRVMFVGSIAMSLRFMTEGVMQASGDSMTPMWITILSRLLHVALCPFLIFGWWVFPEMGVVGAAITNIVSQSLGTVIGLWILQSGRSRLHLSFKGFRFDLGMIWRQVRIGIPASIMGVERTLGQLVLLSFMAPFGTLAVAAHTLGQRIEMILFMPGWGMGMGAGVLAGQNLGAGKPGRAERSGWLAAGVAEGIMITAALAIFLWAEEVSGVFSPDPDLVRTSSLFLRIAAAGYVMMGFTTVLQQCISGAGDTLPPMIFTLLTMWGVQLPVAFFLPRMTDLGVLGVRWAIVVGTAAGMVAYITYFRIGRWKRKKV